MAFVSTLLSLSRLRSREFFETNVDPPCFLCSFSSLQAGLKKEKDRNDLITWLRESTK